jgi:transposase
LREGKLAGAIPSLPVFAEVQVAELTPPAPQPAPCPSGFIQIELPGGVRVSVDAGVDADALARVLSVLR